MIQFVMKSFTVILFSLSSLGSSYIHHEVTGFTMIQFNYGFQFFVKRLSRLIPIMIH